MSKVLELNDENFDTQINNADKLMIVDFFASWCGHCRTQAPIFEEFADELFEEAVAAKIDAENNRKTAAKYSISGIPAILVFKNGEVVERKSGVQSKDELKKMIERHRS